MLSSTRSTCCPGLRVLEEIVVAVDRISIAAGEDVLAAITSGRSERSRWDRSGLLIVAFGRSRFFRRGARCRSGAVGLTGTADEALEFADRLLEADGLGIEFLGSSSGFLGAAGIGLPGLIVTAFM